MRRSLIEHLVKRYTQSRDEREVIFMETIMRNESNPVTTCKLVETVPKGS